MSGHLVCNRAPISIHGSFVTSFHGPGKPTILMSGPRALNRSISLRSIIRSTICFRFGFGLACVLRSESHVRHLNLPSNRCAHCRVVRAVGSPARCNFVSDQMCGHLGCGRQEVHRTVSNSILGPRIASSLLTSIQSVVRGRQHDVTGTRTGAIGIRVR